MERAVQTVVEAAGGDLDLLNIACCSQSCQTSILEAFRSDASAKLQAVYDDINFGNRPDDVDYKVWNEMTGLSRNISDAISDIAHIAAPDNEDPAIAVPAQDEDKIPEGSKLFNCIFLDIQGRADVRLQAKAEA